MKDEQLSFQRAERGKNEKKKMFIYKDPSTDPQDTHAPAKLKKKKSKAFFETHTHNYGRRSETVLYSQQTGTCIRT